MNTSPYAIAENNITTIPSSTNMTPVAQINVFGVALYAKTAAMLAHIRVKSTHNISTVQSGAPPMAKCDAAPVNAVKAIINTLVPTGL